MMRKFLFLATWSLLAPLAMAQSVTFQASDGLTISAELYRAETPKDTVIVLFHQARSSRGEYSTIAPRLNALGYSALAVDQRSGGKHSGVINQTSRVAKAAGKATGYLDARADLLAAVVYARDVLQAKRVVVWGSSYSASLVLALAGQRPEWVDGVLSFSPGEYFRSDLKVAQAARGIDVPTFITSAKSEFASWATIREAVGSEYLSAFRPSSAGGHGSSALLPVSGTENAEYWEAVESFLASHFD